MRRNYTIVRFTGNDHELERKLCDLAQWQRADVVAVNPCGMISVTPSDVKSYQIIYRT